MTDPVGQWPETLSSRMHELLRVATAPAPLAPVASAAVTPTQGEHAERELPSDTPTPLMSDESLA